MLSNEEKQELKALARSRQLREDFHRLRELDRRRAPQSVDDYLRFLGLMRQIQAYQVPPRPFPIYSNIRL